MKKVPHFSPSALVCDIDGTITDEHRRINTDAILALRMLIDGGVPVVLASGNTICAINILCRMIGTDGSIIAENGGVYRNTFQGKPCISGDHRLCWKAFEKVKGHFASKGVELELYSPDYRFADVAFAKTVKPEEVREVLSDQGVMVLDTGFAIHIQSPGINKGTALLHLSKMMEIDPSDFMAIGDSENDAELLRNAGLGVVVANGHPDIKSSADYVTKKAYGDGFVEAVKTFFSHFFER